MTSKPIKILFLLLFVFAGFSSLFVQGATTLSNESRTPSLEGDTDIDYLCDYRVDYILQDDLPLRTVDLFRLYYRINAGGYSYVSMSVLDSNTYKKDDFSPSAMGASAGDTIGFYFYIKDSEGDSDTTITKYFDVNPDIENPSISGLTDEGNVASNEPITLSATITDNDDITSALVYYSIDNVTWTSQNMSEGGSNVWSYTIPADTFDLDDEVSWFVSGTDTTGNIMYNDDHFTTDYNTDTIDFTEGDDEGCQSTFWDTETFTDGYCVKNTKYHSSSGTYFAQWQFGDGGLNPVPNIDLETADHYITVIRLKATQGTAHLHYFWESYNGLGYKDYECINSLDSAWDIYIHDMSQYGDWTGDLSRLGLYAQYTSDFNVYVDYLMVIGCETFIIEDNENPVISNLDYSPHGAWTDDAVTVSCDVIDNVAVDTVLLKYRTNDGEWSEYLSTTESPSGTYWRNIGTFSLNDDVDYYFHATDTSSNVDVSGYQSFVVEDTDNPVLSNPDHSPTNPEETDSITLSVDVSDERSGLDEVKCFWRVDEGSWSNHTMSGSGTYSYEIGTFSIDEDIDYYFTATDNEANTATLNNGGSYYQISIADQSNPILSNPDHSPSNPSDINAVEFSVDVTDNGDINSVLLYYRIDGGSWIDESLSLDAGDTYHWWKSAGFDVNELIEYYYWADDVSSNEATLNNGGSYYSFNVTDNSVPVISGEARDPSGDIEQGISITISATITDNFDVKSARAYYRIDDGEWQYEIMSEGESNVWSISIGSFDYEEDIDWYVWAEDYHSNTQNSASDSFIVEDITDPTLSNPDHVPTNPDEEDSIILSVDASDDRSGIHKVVCYWRVDLGGWDGYLMALDTGTTYIYDIGTFEIGEDLDYYFWANDTAGNTKTLNNGGSYYQVSVTDQTNPILSSPSHLPANPDETDNIIFEVYVSENGDWDTIIVYYRINEGSWTDLEMIFHEVIVSGYTTSWRKTISNALYDIDDEIEYYFWCNDTASNEATLNNGGEYYSITIIDDTAPEISNQARNPSGDIEQGTNITISATITDNYDVKIARVYYRVNDGEWQNISMSEGGSNVWSASIGSFSYEDDIDFYVWAEDYHSNTNNTNSDSFIIVDVTAPTINTPEHSPTNPDENDGVTLSVNASDTYSGIDMVLCFWRVDEGSWSNHTMSGSGTYAHVIGTFAIGEDIDYYFWANDTASNEATLNNGGNYYSFIVTDQTNPVLSNPSHYPSNPTDVNAVEFSVDVTDNENIDTVLLYYRINTGSWTEQELSLDTGDTYHYWKSVAFDVAEFIEYYYWANDTTSNEATLDNGGSYYSFTVLDNSPPVISNHSRNPETVHYDQSVTVTCDVTDNYQINWVRVYYRVDEGEWQYVNMTNTEGDTFSVTIGSFNYNEHVDYYIKAQDNSTSHNEANSSTYDFNVGDNTIPDITDVVYSPEEIEQYNYVTINCSVTDDSGISHVTIAYRINEGFYTYENMTHVAGNDYTINVTCLGGVGNNWSFFIKAYDVADNFNQTSPTIETIFDFTSPVISDVAHTPNSPIHSDDVIISCSVVDLAPTPIERVYYKENNGDWNYAELSVGYHEANIGNFSYFVTVNYYIYVEDSSGNNATSSTHIFQIPDSIFPEITQHSVSYSQTPIRTNEGRITIMYNITDNVGISSTAIYYKHEQDQDWTQDTLILVEEKYQYVFENFETDGWYYYYLLARDIANNEEQSIIYSFYVSEGTEGENPLDKPAPPNIPDIIERNPTAAIAIPSTALLVFGISILVSRINAKNKKKKKGGYGNE